MTPHVHPGTASGTQTPLNDHTQPHGHSVEQKVQGKKPLETKTEIEIILFEKTQPVHGPPFSPVNPSLQRQWSLLVLAMFTV